MSNCCDSKTSCSASATVPVADTVDNQPNTPSLRYRIQAMDCPTEEALIRNKLSKLPGVHQLDFNLVQRVLTVHIENIEPVVIEAHLHELGFVPEKIEPSTKPQDTHAPESDAPPVGLLAVSGVAAVVAEMLEFSGLGEPVWVAALALIAIACGGWKTYQKGWVALKNRTLNINALMSIAVTGAALIGQWPEAGGPGRLEVTGRHLDLGDEHRRVLADLDAGVQRLDDDVDGFFGSGRGRRHDQRRGGKQKQQESAHRVTARGLGPGFEAGCR